jgi:tripartite-type tricarboxylate transporter receptor subunit TctC
MELLQLKAGIRLLHVTYKGLGPALTDLVAGRIDVMLDNLGTSAPHIERGELKGLGIGAERRTTLFPGLPALSEDVPGLTSTTWFALVAPPRTPDAIVATLYASVSDVLKEPEVRGRFRNLYATPIGDPPATTKAFFDQERTHWRSVITAAGIKLE